MAVASGVAGTGTSATAAPHAGKQPHLSGNALQMSHMQPYLGAMEHTAEALAPRFEKLGIHLTPEIMMAIAMQESGNKPDPKSTRSFDNGLGIMQITPSKTGQLDADVAKILGWDNKGASGINWRGKDAANKQGQADYLNQHNGWQDPQTNIDAGGLVLAKKAESLQRLLPDHMWDKMTEDQRLRATMFAYNAGEGNAVAQLKKGGPDATLLSTYTDPHGKQQTHDYTQEIKGRLDYVNSHSPFHSVASSGHGALAAGAATKPNLSAGAAAASGSGAAGTDVAESPVGMWRD